MLFRSQTMMAHRVGAEEQGELQGASSSLLGLAGIVGPGLFSAAFTLAVASEPSQMPGMPYLIAGILTATAWAVGLRATRRSTAV